MRRIQRNTDSEKPAPHLIFGAMQDTQSGKRARLLLVDDFEIVRAGLRDMLSEHKDWEICGEAENGQVAIQKVAELQPDLVFMDVNMPVMNGLEATRQIRNIAPNTKIVMFSMYDSTTLAEEAKGAGADVYLPKSASLEVLEETIDSLLREDPSSAP